MTSNTPNPEALTTSGSGTLSRLATTDSPGFTKSATRSQEVAAEAARFLTREQVYESAEQASHFLACLMNHVAADDTPGIRYCYAKFAAHGRVVALGCKDLIASPEGGAR